MRDLFSLVSIQTMNICNPSNAIQTCRSSKASLESEYVCKILYAGVFDFQFMEVCKKIRDTIS